MVQSSPGGDNRLLREEGKQHPLAAYQILKSVKLFDNHCFEGAETHFLNVSLALCIPLKLCSILYTPDKKTNKQIYQTEDNKTEKQPIWIMIHGEKNILIGLFLGVKIKKQY